MLFKIAMADGEFHPNEKQMLISAAKIFGFDDSEFERIKSIYIDDISKYYAILDCNESDSVEKIKNQYRKLAMEYHPDKIISKGLPPEFVELANDKFREIKEAYDRIRTERNLN